MFGIKNGKKLTLVTAFTLLIFTHCSEVNAKEYSDDDLKEKIEQIVDWKKADMKQSITAPLFSNVFLKNAGNSVVDWYPFGMGRAGYPDDYDAYTAIVEQKVEQRYKQKGQLSESKATEWHRISLAYLAAGGDATDVNGHNLIADGVYNRGKTADLGTQGINGLIWGLITLDAMRYDIPKNAFETREGILKRILALQLNDGGFSLNQKKSDIDMTAMALSALAPYYNSEEKFSFLHKASNEQVKKSAREVIDQALTWLSKKQQKNGDFSSDGTPNLESTAQVAVALAALHIDVEKDERFIKNKQSIIDGLRDYENSDGGFIHAKTFNDKNPTSKPDESNSMASEQALYAFVALYREKLDERTLFDFRAPQSTTVKNEIYDAEKAISNLEKEPATVKQAIKKYKKVPTSERSYIANYVLLERIVKKQKMQLDEASLTSNQNINEKKSEMPEYFQVTSKLSKEITKQVEEKVKGLLKQPISTEHQAEIEKYRKLWKAADNKKDYIVIGKQLEERSQLIVKQIAKLNDMNEAILEYLYPFSELAIKDEQQVKKIISKYNELSSYDKKQIIQYGDVEKSMAQINTLKRERLYKYIGIASVIIVISLFVIWKRKKKATQGNDL